MVEVTKQPADKKTSLGSCANFAINLPLNEISPVEYVASEDPSFSLNNQEKWLKVKKFKQTSRDCIRDTNVKKISQKKRILEQPDCQRSQQKCSSNKSLSFRFSLWFFFEGLKR